MKLLKELCECSGIPGREQRLRKIVRRELKTLADDMQVDGLGSLIVKKGASKNKKPKKLMLAAHLDEIGFVVSHIDGQGLLRLVPMGGHDPRNMVAQRVTVAGVKKDYTGLMYPGVKPPHIQTDGDRNRSLSIGDFFVDLYMPVEKVKKEIELGAMVTLQREFAEVGDGVSCKAMDDRLAVYVMIEAMKAAKSFGFETYAVATVQEEIGLRGAVASAYGVDPDVGLALDVTIAADIPGVPEHEQVTKLGQGVAIKIQDSSTISHPGLVTHMKALAKRRKIPFQMEILPRGGTDAGGIQRARAGVPVITLSIPTRYVHTSIELADKKDIQAAIKLLAAFLEDGHRADLDLV
ncbi:MAG: putative aminopeptidase FrvX [Candidatus Latescibacterota bacterium]|jgi:putative aminopeptidase FrvX